MSQEKDTSQICCQHPGHLIFCTDLRLFIWFHLSIERVLQECLLRLVKYGSSSFPGVIFRFHSSIASVFASRLNDILNRIYCDEAGPSQILVVPPDNYGCRVTYEESRECNTDINHVPGMTLRAEAAELCSMIAIMSATNLIGRCRKTPNGRNAIFHLDSRISCLP